jgi:hypothetical protein
MDMSSTKVGKRSALFRWNLRWHALPLAWPTSRRSARDGASMKDKDGSSEALPSLLFCELLISPAQP